jgi:hypothetical protein
MHYKALLVDSKEFGLDVNADSPHGHAARQECTTKSKYKN